MPATLTVLREINHPRYPTVPMRLASETAEVSVWDNKLMKLDENTIGLKGSPTQVRRIFSPERVKGEIIGDGVNKPAETANLLVGKLVEKDIVSL
jgi:electron transfer flavoprotein beta subunit